MMDETAAMQYEQQIRVVLLDAYLNQKMYEIQSESDVHPRKIKLEEDQQQAEEHKAVNDNIWNKYHPDDLDAISHPADPEAED